MDLAAFLEALPRASLSSLYASPAACAAVLRGLCPLSRLYVARLAHLEGGAPEGKRGVDATGEHALLFATPACSSRHLLPGPDRACAPCVHVPLHAPERGRV